MATYPDDDTRWVLARRLLHEDTLATVDRVAGLLVLLYGQMVSRIASLTIDDITATDGVVRLRLGREPLLLPSPLDVLIFELVDRRCGNASLGHTDDHRWLFPGGMPGRPMSAAHLGKRLRAVGIAGRVSRNTALMETAATMPAKAMSELLGIGVTSATRWSELASASRADYAAEISRRHISPHSAE
ncbi:hypothetical protein HJ581_0044075 [Rhodococcus opacus]|nr:hypothetical protein HJ581_0044075 [Rhodococcus opacus]